MKIVQFKDGTFGIRKGWWFTKYVFLDLKDTNYFWPLDHQNFKYSKGTHNQVIEIFNRLNDKGIIYKGDCQ